MRKILALSVLVLASCSREEQPEAPTPAETERLNDAEAMLNELAKEEGPEAEAPSPSNSN